MQKIKPVLGHYFFKYMTSSNCGSVVKIEQDSCENFYDRDDILLLMNERDVRGLIITDVKKPVGYLMWEQNRNKHKISVLNLVIKKSYRRKGLATQLLQKLSGKFRKSKFRNGVFRTLTFPIRETNEDGIKFLANFGLLCSGIIKDYYEHEEENEDALLFYYTAYMNSNKNVHVEETNNKLNIEDVMHTTR